MCELLDLVARARTHLLLDVRPGSIFFSQLAMNLTPRVRPEVGTAATDGKHLFVGPDFANLTDRERVGVLVHEVLHCALRHFARMDGKDLRRWNIAADLSLNPTVLDSGWPLPNDVLLPGVGSFAHLPVGLTAEQYYDMLTPEAEQSQPEPESGEGQGEESDEESEGTGSSGSGDESEGDESGEGQGDGDGDESGDGAGDGDGDGDGDAESDGAGGGEGEGEDQDSDGPSESPSEGGSGGAGGNKPGLPGDFDPGKCGGILRPEPGDEVDEVEWHVRTEIAARQESESCGNAPGFVNEMLARSSESLTETVSWQDLLVDALDSRKDEETWDSFDRRSVWRDMYMPDPQQDACGTVVVLLDVSGSISQDEIESFLAEMDLLVSSVQPERVVLLTHNTHVDEANVTEWLRYEPVPDIRAVSRGGTSHIQPIGYVEREYPEAEAIVCLTDGVTRWPETCTIPVIVATTLTDGPDWTRSARIR